MKLKIIWWIKQLDNDKLWIIFDLHFTATDIILATTRLIVIHLLFLCIKSIYYLKKTFSSNMRNLYVSIFDNQWMSVCLYMLYMQTFRNTWNMRAKRAPQTRPSGAQPQLVNNKNEFWLTFISYTWSCT